MRLLKTVGSLLVVSIAGATGYGVYSHKSTQNSLENFHQQVYVEALKANPKADIPNDLPRPVKRYLDYAFPNGIPDVAVTKVEMSGDFRRPQHNEFNPTTAKQSLSPALPALMFEANTPILPGIWAIAYDAYLGGRMEMKAKVLGAFTVMDQPETRELNRISLRRWLLEAPLYPQAFIPSKYIRWEAIDENHARVIASFEGLETSMIAKVDSEGKLVNLRAEGDGDLNTPYHGSGEYAARSDYRLVDGMMIPHKFVIARHSQGVDYPFWKGQITSYSTTLYSDD